MRLPLLFLIFLSSAAALSKSWTEGITSLFSREERPEHERLPNFYDLPQEAIHKRVKRAVYAALGFASQCEPGWTGQYCENPICSDVGTLPSNTYAYQLLDILSLPSGCTGKYYVPVDSNSFIITIEVNAAGKAFVNLTDTNGNVMPNEGIITEGYTMVRYTNIPPGPYQMTVDNGGIPTTNCIAEITSYSGLSVVQRFSSSPQSDVAPYSESAMEGSPMYFIAHVNNLTNPGEPAATTAPPTPVTPSTHVNCANGGTPLYQGSVNATCFCPELFYGRECDQVNCMNGGTPLDGNQQCLCPPGFKGVNCQTVSCTVNEGPYLTDTKTLIVVIRTTTSMSQYISQVVNAITAEVENNNMYETDVYQSYVLVKFANGQYETQYYAQSIFQMFLNDLMDAIYTKNVGGCNETTFNAISSVFVEPISPKSSIYVFTDVVASDPNSWRTVAESNTRRKLPIYMNVLPNKDCPLNVYSEGYRALTRASAYSGGLVQQPTLESLEPIFQFTMRSTSYKMNAVLMDDMNQCDTGGSRFFLVDSSVEAVIIFAVGQNLVLSVTDPNWDKTAAMLIYNYGTSYFWEVTSVIPGEYMLSLSATNVQNSCSYRVMARSDFDLFLATANVIDEDASDSEPVVGKSKHIVAQLNGLVNAVQDPFRLFAEIAITTNMNSEGKVAEPMYFSNGKYRSGCGYHLYFGQASFCQFQDQQFYATVFADDNNGYTIQRTTTGYCSMSTLAFNFENKF
ncbi:unnamed protein product [Nippostrongylus brasiliensis]|uniref:EGF-like domain-containing protein n=1 Tax=Nippostrongylus brasiliensis TaxID=27835 RepID=A0A158R1K3_NIPBR|nr:unnamed protein product [Nippostrongylus brasiliensis]